MLFNQDLESLKDSKFKGEFAQLRVQIAAAHKGISVAIPTTEDRFDIVICYKDRLSRAQIKFCDRYSSRSRNTLELVLYNNKLNKKCYTKEDIDELLVFVPKVDRILSFGPDIFHNKKTITIELENKNSPWFWEKFKW